MIEFIDLGMEMQKRVIEAHEKSIEAAHVVEGTETVVAVQQAMNDAAKANLDFWGKWMSFWGLRK
jgi:hypothetical protein